MAEVCSEEKSPLIKHEKTTQVDFDKPEEEPPNWHYW